jgi:NAD-dependent SIR2 family protein deacetylase
MKVSTRLNILVTQGRGTRNFTATISSKTKGPNPRTAVLTNNEFIDPLPLMRSKAKRLAEKFRAHKGSNLIFCGAGLSTSCGIPDYRSTYKTFLPTGPGKYETDTHRAHWSQSHKQIDFLETHQAFPSLSHLIIKSLQANNYISGIVSQNVDGLFTHLNLPTASLIDLHGNILYETCTNPHCSSLYLRDFSTILPSDRDPHPNQPRLHYASRDCKHCSFPLRDTIIYFNEVLNPNLLKAASDLFNRSEFCLVLGSSLTVSPAGKFVNKFFSKGEVCIAGLQKTL